MVKIGFQASHEQFSPSELLQLVQLAESAGFEFVLSSDHIAPWGSSQHHSGFALSWLGAAMQATTISFGMVSVPGYRYHPAILAQAIATLCELFPGRFFPCLGSGEALNEHITGQAWPEKPIRNRVLRESVEVMRRLWKGETVSYQGHITVDEAKIYSLPKYMPTIYGAALSDQTAQWLGEWADGLITTVDELPALQKRIAAFLKSASSCKPLLLKTELSYDRDECYALDQAYEQWRYPLLDPTLLGDLRLPADFERESHKVTKEEVAQKIKIITDPRQAIEWIEELAELGFGTIVLHNVNLKQEAFIRDFGEHVLPHFKALQVKLT